MSSDFSLAPETRAGDGFAYAGEKLARREVWIMAGLIDATECERCGAVAETEMDDGVALCEGCAYCGYLGW